MLQRQQHCQQQQLQKQQMQQQQQLLQRPVSFYLILKSDFKAIEPDFKPSCYYNLKYKS
jgi:hypothetical protein